MVKSDDEYIPALSYRRLTPLYDPFMKWIMRENAFKTCLIKESNLNSNQMVLDLGCGTGTLTILIKEYYPGAEVFGLDGDEEVLKTAKYKSKKEGINVNWDYGLSFELPYPDNYFDRVIASMFIHHLNSKNKIRTFKEVLRVLKTDGEFYIVDFGRPQNILMHIISLIIIHLEETADSINGLLPDMLLKSGFSNVEVIDKFMTVFGTICVYRIKIND